MNVRDFYLLRFARIAPLFLLLLAVLSVLDNLRPILHGERALPVRGLLLIAGPLQQGGELTSKTHSSR